VAGDLKSRVVVVTNAVNSDLPGRSGPKERDGAAGGACGRRVWLVLLAALVASTAARAEPVGFRFATENDVLTRNPTDDDLYTFAVAFELERAPYRFTLRENAFTDRQEGVRFDETSLSVGRALNGPAPWSARLEAGVVRVGRGLLGQDAQNAIHRLIGDEEVDLEYYGSSLHPRLGLEAERVLITGRRLAVGARVEASTTPGLRSDVVAGAEGAWEPRRWLGVRVFGGLRYAHASLAPLEPHVERFAPAARVAVTVYDSVFVAWTHNDYGDGREHISLGLRAVPGAPRLRSRADASASGCRAASG
jgi:hypothetical protein